MKYDIVERKKYYDINFVFIHLKHVKDIKK